MPSPETMLTTLPSVAPSSGKHRKRASAKNSRRFSDKNLNKKTILPVPVAISQKTRKLNNALRYMAITATFLIAVSTFCLWRGRQLRNSQIASNFDLSKAVEVSVPHAEVLHDIETNKVAARSADEIGRVSDGEDSVHPEAPHQETGDGEAAKGANDLSTEKAVIRDESAGETQSNNIAEKDISPERLVRGESEPERIEWYTRDDYKDGSRPLCRVSNPIVLSNGTILFPDWMREKNELLKKCGLGVVGFYSKEMTKLTTISLLNEIDADFALTVHLERFQEPTHVPSVFLTEHVLKASFLFDTFNSKADVPEDVKQYHCTFSKAGTQCDLPHSSHNALKAAIFVPKRIEKASHSNWPKTFVKMFGNAHNDGNEVLHLNISKILIKAHATQSEVLVGTRFRSIMATDGMFRHLPHGALGHSSFYSPKNGINKEERRMQSTGPCSITIGIAASHDVLSGFDEVADLSQKIRVLARLAIPRSNVQVKQIQASSADDFEEHIRQMQEVDIYVAGSGNDMNSMGFLHAGSKVIELMPFGIRPDTHRSLARALSLDHDFISGKPQDESFTQCIEGEVLSLRKKGNLEFSENPEWKEPLLKAWNDAVAEFVMSGSTKFDVLSTDEPVNNYFSKLCALKQKIVIDLDETTRDVITTAKRRCSHTPSSGHE